MYLVQINADIYIFLNGPQIKVPYYQIFLLTWQNQNPRPPIPEMVDCATKSTFGYPEKVFF
jgi:hypothetical protein